MSKSVFLEIKPGDCVAVQPPRQRPWLGQVLHVDGDACFSDLNCVQVIREDDLAVIGVCPSWILDGIPGAGMRVMG